MSLFKTLGRLARRAFGQKAINSFSAETRMNEVIAQTKKRHVELAAAAEDVVARRTKAQMVLEQATRDRDKIKVETMQAVKLREKAKADGDEKSANDWNSLAENGAHKLTLAEAKITTTLAQVETMSAAAETAKEMVKNNRLQLERAVAEQQNVLDKVAFAEMQERSNAVIAQLNMPTDDFTDTVQSLSEEADTRMAKALAGAEMDGDSLDGKQRQLQAALINNEASGALAALEAEMKEAGQLPQTTSTEKTSK